MGCIASSDSHQRTTEICKNLCVFFSGVRHITQTTEQIICSHKFESTTRTTLFKSHRKQDIRDRFSIIYGEALFEAKAVKVNKDRRTGLKFERHTDRLRAVCHSEGEMPEHVIFRNARGFALPCLKG